jgi:hypothetical protein
VKPGGGEGPFINLANSFSSTVFLFGINLKAGFCQL